MKFSIFTPFFDYLDSVEQLYTSIVNQTYDNWEWLITDDFSTDPQVKEKLLELEQRDSRIRFIESKWKKEFFYNLPINYSTGDIILKIDSDDIPSVKLIEVYKYCYEKFPDVISIGCSSIIKVNSHNSTPTAAKYINYKNTSNFMESETHGVQSVIGDARSYKISALKNNGIFVRDYEYKFERGEDIHKILMVEEWGKFFAVPRILHHYLMREKSNSASYTINNSITDEKRKKQSIFRKKIEIEADLRFGREKLFSIEKYFDYSFGHAKNFFFSDLENQINPSKIEYWSKKVCIEDMKRLNELYFEHELFYNERIKNPNYIVIDAVENLGIIFETLKNRELKNCIVVITCLNDDGKNALSEIQRFGYGTWFNIFNYTTYKLSL